MLLHLSNDSCCPQWPTKQNGAKTIWPMQLKDPALRLSMPHLSKLLRVSWTLQAVPPQYIGDMQRSEHIHLKRTSASLALHFGSNWTGHSPAAVHALGSAPCLSNHSTCTLACIENTKRQFGQVIAQRFVRLHVEFTVCNGLQQRLHWASCAAYAGCS